jgi:lipopolysaccharide export system ATP-binding protein
MKAGAIIAGGTAQEIKENEMVREHYLGKDFTF